MSENGVQSPSQLALGGGLEPSGRGFPLRSHSRATRKNQFVFQSAEWFDLPVRFGWYMHLGFLGREGCDGGGGVVMVVEGTWMADGHLHYAETSCV